MATCLILAGGFGTRVKEVLGDTPKPLATVNGKPFLFWIAQSLHHYGFDRLIFLAHFEARKIIEFAHNLDFPDIKIEVIVEEQPLGTAGSVVNALEKLPDIENDLFIINGDSIIITDLKILSSQMSVNSEFSLFGIEMDDCSRYGTLEINAEGDLVKFNEKSHAVSGIINSGIYYTAKAFFKKLASSKLPLSLEYDFIPNLLQSGHNVKVVTKENIPFIDIGTYSSLAEADGFIKKHFTKRKMDFHGDTE